MALHAAALAGINAVLKILLKYGADVIAVNEAGKSPLDLAFRTEHFDTAELLRS